MIVGLGGYAFAGKDAVADVLEARHGWKRTFMSKPLMRALLALDPLIPDGRGYIRFAELVERVGYDRAKRNPEVRALLQRLGTEVGRNIIGENVWTDVMARDVAELSADGSSVAVTGIRYRNELDRIREMGGISVWVSRPGVVAVNGLTSELTLDPADFDVELRNDGTLADLEVAVGALLAGLLTSPGVRR